jgi:hypothetical protein
MEVKIKARAMKTVSRNGAFTDECLIACCVVF